jgi:uncharacterized protein
LTITHIAVNQFIEIFIDTSYAIALYSKRDHYHNKALELGRKYGIGEFRFVTSFAILLEIGNGLSKSYEKPRSVQLLNFLQKDPAIEIEEVTKNIYQQSFELFSSRMDQDWGLVDCTSFLIMKKRGINLVLTADKHFEQAGFRALMRE